jgi:hypothetical protein
MTKRTRENIGVAPWGLCMSSLLSLGWLCCVERSYDPRTPQPALGRVYLSHSSARYLTAQEAAADGLLTLTLFTGMAMFFACVPKGRPGPLDPPTPIGMTREQSLIVLVSSSIFLTAIYFGGPDLVHLAVSHGIVLSFLQ